MSSTTVRQSLPLRDRIRNPGRFRLLSVLALLAPSLVTGCPATGTAGMALTAEDKAAIRALDASFVQGWLRDDTTAVLSVFRADAILQPPGSQPVSGLSAIRSYWWPTDGSHTRIIAFDRHIDEVEGTRGLAFIRGTARLVWTTRHDLGKTGDGAPQSSKSSDLILVAPDSSGTWRIVRQMWGTLP